MKKEFYLSDLAPYLLHTHLKINLNFLSKLLKDASKSETPWKNINFGKKLNCSINLNKKSSLTIYGWFKGYRTVPMEKLNKILPLSKYSWKDIEKNLISIKSGIKKGEVKPNFPIKIDFKLGCICGHILGDGSIDKGLHSIFFSNSNNELIEEFYECMDKIFGVKGRIWVQDKPAYNETKWLKRVYKIGEIPKENNAGIFYPKVCSDIAYVILGKFAEGNQKSITKEIKESPKEFKMALLRAFFDDEGSVDANSYNLRWHQDRKEILEDLRKFLFEMGINPNPIRNYLKNGKIRYYFNITHLREYALFNKIIGCTSTLKRTKLENLIHKARNSKRYRNLNDSF